MSRIRLPRRPDVTPRRFIASVTGVAVCTVVTVLIALAPSVAYAAPGQPSAPTVHDLPTVINGLQNWLMGILAALATLYLVLAGVYYATAGGDPSQVDKAKSALKNALVGYGLAVLAPVLLQIVQGIVGG